MAKQGHVRREPANRLLALLDEEERSALEPLLEPVPLVFKQVLCEPRDPLEHVYFPTTGIVSEVKNFENGDVIEVATFGSEGVVEVSLVLGEKRPGSRLIVQVAGEALRMESAAFLELVAKSPKLHALLLRYAYAVFRQVSQTAACNRAHTVDERCARWLLMTHDRVGERTFELTQEFMAQMLGVHRPSVSLAARMLQQAGLVTYSRGRITVLDREGLEAASCECYGVIAEIFKNLLRKPG
jgi:CRP-like cAMP-binding protein